MFLHVITLDSFSIVTEEDEGDTTRDEGADSMLQRATNRRVSGKMSDFRLSGQHYAKITTLPFLFQLESTLGRTI